MYEVLAQADVGTLVDAVNTTWALTVAFLIFFMQPGFALLEAGQVRAKNVGNVLMKNMTDWTLGVLAYFLVGYGVAGIVGPLTSGRAIQDPFAYMANPEGWVTWLVGAVFAMTAATIVSGAVAGRMNFTAYVFVAAVMTAIIYPVSEGITWWGGLLAINEGAPNGFVADAIGVGYLDFAGATVVHMLGGLAGLVGAYMVGPREGRYDENGNSQAIPGHSMLLAVLGTLILAFGWFGFNVGTSSIMGGDGAVLSAQLGRVALNTTLGMGAGGVAAMIVSAAWQGKPDPLWTANGLLAGLVAVTGAVPHVSWVGGIVLGALAGALVLPTFRWVVDSLKIDDVCGVFVVHGSAGAIGTILIPVFSTSGFSATQLAMQVVGVAVIGLWAVVATAVTFAIADALFGLRVSEQEEEEGLDLSEHGVSAYPEFVGESGGSNAGAVTTDGGRVETDGGVPVADDTAAANGGDAE
ncbi:ammonium transporter [Halosegnis marinus]|uniref:Ammonium transporter n=1 Tax=Halosegnis marinus TaxID=3034023 RepID=A0ABD5ZPU0_9EURY|nr:ammonium transporter [Halosegnis sp. DT85]